MSSTTPAPAITIDDATSLAKMAGVHDVNHVASLHRWFEAEALELRNIPDLADKLKGDEEAAESELRPLFEVTQEFAERVRAAPHALERVRMLYAEELSRTLIVDLEEESQRRLDQDLISASRLLTAIGAAREQVKRGSAGGPALLGPHQAAQRLIKKYKEINDRSR